MITSLSENLDIIFNQNHLKLMRIALLFIIASHLSFGQNPDKIKVLIVDGFSNHDWKQTTKITKQILESSGLFKIEVSTMPSFENQDLWRLWSPNFSEFDIVIQNTNNINQKEIRWPEKVEKSLEKYVRSGGGLYILHSANNAFAHWDEYNLMIGLGWRSEKEGIAIQVGENGEIIKIPVGEGKATYHGPRNDEVIYKYNDHPINQDFPNAWLTPDMELYKYARGSAENLTALSFAIDDETGIQWPVEWVIDYGKGRVYNSSMGHLWKGQTYPVSFRCIGFQTTMIRATEWLATGKVTYKVPENFPTEEFTSLASE